jgi:hypothetical protein
MRKIPNGGIHAVNGTKVTAKGPRVSRYNGIVSATRTSWFLRAPERSLDCWVDFLVCPRRYLAVLPAHARANLFAGD